MTKLTIDETEYDIDDFTDEQKAIVNLIQYNDTVVRQLEHELQCVSAVGKMKVNELKQSLGHKDEE
tara:strand:+ start:565 stop:762 length:198 start_codon:yes stop_codon:yes gene_type:complete